MSTNHETPAVETLPGDEERAMVRDSLSEGADGVVAGGRFEQLLRFSPVAVIGGGTNEIQRNLIAQRGLGLPR